MYHETSEELLVLGTLNYVRSCSLFLARFIHNNNNTALLGFIYLIHFYKINNLHNLSCCFFLSCKANARIKPAKTGHGQHSSNFRVFLYIVFFLVLCIVCVYMCTVLLPPGGYPIAVNKYIVSYHIPYIFIYNII